MAAPAYEIKLATSRDLACLADIERTAARLFRDCVDATGLTEEQLAATTPTATLEEAQRNGRVWVAAEPHGEIVGFAVVIDVGGYAHLQELSVLPLHGRRGVASALLDRVCSWANARGYPAVTLSTFRLVPWNMPFYERRGFSVVASSDLSDAHRSLVAEEKRLGLRTDLRVVMIRPNAK